MSHEIYRKVTGEVSDVITNIIAFKTGGAEDRSRDTMASLTKQETTAFELRRRLKISMKIFKKSIKKLWRHCAISIAKNSKNFSMSLTP
jgi:hypothetical protein